MKGYTKLLVLTILITMCIGFYVLYSVFLGIHNNVVKEIRLKECYGTIESIKKTQPCFIEISVKEENRIIDLNVQDCCRPGDTTFFRFISIGDSIFKRSGKLKLLVRKVLTLQTKEFDYPLCVQ